MLIQCSCDIYLINKPRLEFILLCLPPNLQEIFCCLLFLMFFCNTNKIYYKAVNTNIVNNLLFV